MEMEAGWIGRGSSSSTIGLLLDRFAVIRSRYRWLMPRLIALPCGSPSLRIHGMGLTLMHCPLYEMENLLSVLFCFAILSYLMGNIVCGEIESFIALTRSYKKIPRMMRKKNCVRDAWMKIEAKNN